MTSPRPTPDAYDELDGNAKSPRRLGVRIALFDKRNGALA
jgi:hypothetical protein